MNKINCTLLVDDDNITNFINRRLISKLNIANQVKTAGNGVEALEYINDYCSRESGCCPDLILLDINMPVMDGFDFLNVFNNTKYKDGIIVVMLTTSTNPNDLNRIKEYCITDYITKPLTEEKIMVIYQKYFIDNQIQDKNKC